MSDYYCEYCGRRYSSVRELTGNKCPRHPEGTNKGFHSLYEGSEKSSYACKYCGRTYKSIHDMSQNPCSRNPQLCGYHLPAL